MAHGVLMAVCAVCALRTMICADQAWIHRCAMAPHQGNGHTAWIGSYCLYPDNKEKCKDKEDFVFVHPGTSGTRNTNQCSPSPTGSQNYCNWATNSQQNGTPNDGTRSFCVALDNGGAWENHKCCQHKEEYYICELTTTAVSTHLTFSPQRSCVRHSLIPLPL